jgi:hypothetical protein
MSGLYDTDFVAWADEQARLLRERRFDQLDLDNLTEEVESLAGNHRDALQAQIQRLLTALLKYAYTMGARDPERLWQISAREARNWVLDRVVDHPSLRRYLEAEFTFSYPRACRDAHDHLSDFHETHAPFPDTCPWTLEQVLHQDFWPRR